MKEMDSYPDERKGERMVYCILRILNNNALLAEEKGDGSERILLGKGIGFGKRAGDEVTIDLRESEVKKAGSGSASAEKIQLMTQRMSAENQSEERSGESGGGSGGSDSGSSSSGSSGSSGSGGDNANSADSDSPRQAEANAEVPGSRAASLEESDYKGFAEQIQHIFSERDIEALARLCASISRSEKIC